MSNKVLDAILAKIAELPAEQQAALAGMDVDQLTKKLFKPSSGATRFEKLMYNRYRQRRQREELEMAMKVLRENGLSLPQYSKTPEDYRDEVLENELKKAKAGSKTSLETLQEATKRGLIDESVLAEIA